MNFCAYIKSAKTMAEKMKSEVWDVLDYVIKDQLNF